MDDEAWEIYAFEASPFLQRYVNDYTDYKNGIREEPIVKLATSRQLKILYVILNTKMVQSRVILLLKKFHKWRHQTTSSL